MSYEKINNKLFEVLNEKYHDQIKVLEQPMCDIDGSFLGFVDIYYYLSKIIPKHFTVLDLGCAYASQAYYFRKHKKYIGIDVSIKTRFKFKNTEHKIIDINEELKNWENENTNEVFAICSYVPINTTKLRETFKNVFTFYPSGKY